MHSNPPIPLASPNTRYRASPGRPAPGAARGSIQLLCHPARPPPPRVAGSPEGRSVAHEPTRRPDLGSRAGWTWATGRAQAHASERPPCLFDPPTGTDIDTPSEPSGGAAPSRCAGVGIGRRDGLELGDGSTIPSDPTPSPRAPAAGSGRLAPVQATLRRAKPFSIGVGALNAWAITRTASRRTPMHHLRPRAGRPLAAPMLPRRRSGDPGRHPGAEHDLSAAILAARFRKSGARGAGADRGGIGHPPRRPRLQTSCA